MELFAYLDPGTGSLVLQVIIGGVLAVGVALKAYWSRIRRLFGGKSKAASETKSDKSAE